VRAVPKASAEATIRVVRSALQGQKFESAHNVYVLDGDGRLIGLVPMHHIVTGGPDQTLADVMHSTPPAAYPHDDQEHVADIAVSHGMSEVPVVDEGLRMLGVVPAETLMRVLRQEHIEDLHRFTGIMNGESQAHQSLEAAPWQRAKNRLPWLMVGLLGSVLATWVMAYFEATLEARIAVAFFIPGIVYLADAIGTQTEAVAVRGISFAHNYSVRSLLAGEIKTGLMIGSILGCTAIPVVLAFFRDIRLAAAVGLAIFVAGGTATGVGMFFPWLLFKAGKDPALGSGPIATIIQDVLSILVYFLIVILMVK
jgi:magnesium transporter